MRVQGLVEIPDPTNADHLQQLMCAIKWMRQYIPQYATLATPLLVIVDAAAKKAGSRKSQQLSKVSPSEVGWSREHVDAFGVVREALVKMVPLAHPDPAQAVCLFCDAPQDSWGAICTQVAEQDLGKPSKSSFLLHS
ncbi:unnamed protein product [Phytophthora fragariaefolia]|uniref:Unnamed protein product n=1 Tax=Phytophthora fragariaefolia TaxID=1490495 RepID=A0A9W7CVZ4_9STRA|nr:unnamed protein product [Phytophthora fragariaefolia]